jgi:hypothetical protein
MVIKYSPTRLAEEGTRRAALERVSVGSRGTT